MFKIDLLKGKGVPVKSGPEGIIVVAMAFAVPVIVAIVMIGLYLSNGIVMSIQQQEIADYEKNIKALSYAVKRQESFEKEKNIIDNCLSEVASSISRHIQWSPILVTLVENMPGSMVLTRLEVKQLSVKREIPQKNNPDKMISTSVPVRTLQLSITGNLRHDCDRAVRDFRDRLRSSTVLGPRLEDIRVSQKSDKLENQNIVSYEIDCIFKPGL